MTKIEKRLKEIQEEQQRLFVRLANEKANKKFRCVCGKEHKIKDCEAIQTHYYNNEPYNERWVETDIHIVCPIKGIRNRIYFPIKTEIDYEDRNKYEYNLEDQFSDNYKRLFKRVTDEYDDNGINRPYSPHNCPKFINNFDKNYKKFGLKMGKKGNEDNEE